MSIRDNLGGGSAGSVLDTLEEIEANTEAGKAAGALAVKELNDSLQWFIDNGYLPDPNSEPLIPTMTSNTCSVGTVSSGSYSIENGNYEPYKVFDGNDKGTWSSGSGLFGFRGTTIPNYIQFTFNTEKTVKSAMYVPRYDGAAAESPKEAVLQVSLDNGSNWVNVSDVFTQNSAYSSRIENRLIAKETYSSKYWRLYFKSNIKGTTDICCVNEMQFYGK